LGFLVDSPSQMVILVVAIVSLTRVVDAEDRSGSGSVVGFLGLRLRRSDSLPRLDGLDG